MRYALMLVVLLAAASCTQTSLTPIDPSSDAQAEHANSTQETVELGFAHLRENDLPDAYAAFDKAIHSPGFAKLPEDQRYRTLLVAGQIAEKNGDHNVAHALLVQASESSAADSDAWFNRWTAAVSMNDFMDGAHCIAVIARRWPEAMDQLDYDGIYNYNIYVVHANLSNGKEQIEADRNMLESLFDAHWKDSQGEPSLLWRDLARLLLAQGDVSKARVVAMHVRSARMALSMRIDKQFDSLTQHDLKAYDIDRLIAEELAAAKSNATATPNKLRPSVLLQGLLLDTLQYRQALALGDEVIAKSKDGAGKSLYEDFDDQYIWILDQRSRALQHLGRWDEAVRQLEQAARRPEDGGMNISQIINLGFLYASLGKSTEAMDAISDLGSPSPSGRMQLEGVRLLVAIQHKDKAAIASHLAFMREHRMDAIATWEDALLYTDDLDAATDLLVERLENPALRSDALADVQHYADVLEPPLEIERLKRLRAVIARPKTQNALAKVGRIERFNIAPEEK